MFLLDFLRQGRKADGLHRRSKSKLRTERQLGSVQRILRLCGETKSSLVCACAFQLFSLRATTDPALAPMPHALLDNHSLSSESHAVLEPKL